MADGEALGVFNAFTLTIPAPRVLDGARGKLGAGADGPVVLTGARFSSSTLQWTEDADGVFSVAFEVYTQEEGPTGPPV